MVKSLCSSDALRACEAAYGSNEVCAAPPSPAATGRITDRAAVFTGFEEAFTAD